MYSKRTRYIRRIFTLDRYHKGTGIYTWHIEDFEEYLQEQELHYGLHLISEKEEVSIKVEYTNMIWDYQIYFGSYQKKYHPLTKEDDR